MTVSLSSNFLLNARGLTFEDTGSVTWAFNQNANQLTATTSATGTLSSVGLADNSTAPIFTVSNTPLTANGTLDITLNTQAKNLVFAGPTTGANAQPTFRALVAADIPTLSYVTSIGSSNLTIGGTAAVPTVNLSSTQVTNIGLGATALQNATTADSIQGAGTAASPIELIGDSAAPGNLKYYGTNGSGTRGWYASAVVPAVANPSGTIGLTAVNGSTGNWMDAGSTPALSPAIAPTWTGTHIFTGAPADSSVASGVTLGQESNFPRIEMTSNSAPTNGRKWLFQVDASSGALSIQASNDAVNAAGGWINVTRSTTTVTGTTISGPVGVNGNSPPAQSTGWGTPTGGSVQNNYAAGVGATLLATSDAVAQIITVLKQVGILGA